MVGSLNNYDEETLVKMILAGLDRVLKSRKIDKDYLNEVKVHKIVYMVAEDLNLDITRSWYMRGCYVWCNKPINEYFKPYGRIYLDPSPDIIDAINNVIRVLEVFSLKRQDFLKKLYEEFAPSEFRNLYIAYYDFKINYESFLRQLQQSEKLFFIDVDSTLVSSSLSQLHMAITDTIKDHRIVDVFIQYTTLLETIALGLEEKIRNNEVTKEMVDFCQEAYEFYDNEVWKLPATEIANRTMKGRNSREILQKLWRNFNITLSNVKVYLEIYEKRIDELDLNPSEEFLLERIEPSFPAKEYLKALRDL
jgi:hypothetical protein